MPKFSLSSLKQGKIILLLLMFMLLGFLFFMNQERERKIIYKGAAGEEKEAFLARGAYESLEVKSKEMLPVNQGKTAEEKKEKQEENKKEKKEENPEISKEERKEESKEESEEESKAESKAEIGVDGEKKEAGIEDSPEKIQQNREEKKININTATEQELESLKGIGPATAKNIIRYREEYGGFSSIEEIKNVKRIGDKIFEKIKADICV
ncbi:competence protein ComEA [Oribacterium sinus]|uniref:Competence protein ComEA n=1 Tax=Oribacterium sinus TaxID=237576 RepID=A0A7W9SGC3_9FIRM|nr:helix-hairpin-helix domain-containing protein [Oribacterium sinus]MBB6040920.1 competence protein ComEA [Oribacterium sinus]